MPTPTAKKDHPNFCPCSFNGEFVDGKPVAIAWEEGCQECWDDFYNKAWEKGKTEKDIIEELINDSLGG